MKYAILLSLVILCFFSCKKEDIQECYIAKSVSAKIGFRVIDTFQKENNQGQIYDTVVIRDTPLYFPSLESLNFDTNYIFKGIRNSTNLSCFLNPDTNIIQYKFQPHQDTASSDIVTIQYESYPHFISNACGYTYYYTIINATSSAQLVDSVEILNREVNTSQTNNNIILYFTAP